MIDDVRSKVLDKKENQCKKQVKEMKNKTKEKKIGDNYNNKWLVEDELDY